MKQTRKTKGLHILIDLYGCDPHQINSLKFWSEILPASAKAAGMEILSQHFHEFEPQGVTGFVLLSTSHISIHSWPEYGYVACDVFSCSDDTNTQKAADYIIENIESNRRIIQKIKRGYNIMEYLVSPVYRTGKTYSTRVLRKLAEITSVFQNIVVVDLKKFGKSLVIDGLVQTSEFDHEIYDRALLEPLKPTDKHIMILGGGDGYVAQMALKINPKLKITIIDLDVEVINISKKYLNQDIFLNKHVHLNIGDALTYLKTYTEGNNEPVDGIISDLTDNPIGSKGVETKLKNFYREVFTLSKKILKKNGWISVQSGAAQVVPKYTNMSVIIQNLLNKTFNNSIKKDRLIPSFGEKNSFVWSKNI